LNIAAPFFTTKESQFVQDTDFFETKVLVTQKVKVLLQTLHHDLQAKVAAMPLLAPEPFDARLFQFVKGEHLDHFPYQYLDYPKYFKRDEKFTFRTLFWWGHFFVCAWILEGEHLASYKKHLLDDYDQFAEQGLFLSKTETPWEWRKAPEYLLEMRSDNQEEVRALLTAHPFLKVHYYVPFDAAAVSDGTVAERILKTFDTLAPLVLKGD